MHGINTTMSFSHSHRRDDSGELDVFAATRYFSGEACVSRIATRGGRKSLNMPAEAKVPQPQEEVMMNYPIKEKVKLKQPSSPSAKLASFVNSLFHQYYSSSKKKKSTKTLTKSTTTTTNSHDITKRRSSMSIDYYSKSCYYSSSSNKREGYSSSSKKREGEVWGDEFKLKINLNKQEINGFKEEVEDVDDDDGETDISSDLFELKNYDFYLDISRNHELPVYGSSNMGSIRRGTGFASSVAY